MSKVVSMRMVGLDHAVAMVAPGIPSSELAGKLESCLKKCMEDTYIDGGYEACLHGEVVLRVVENDDVMERRFEAGVRPPDGKAVVDLGFASILDVPALFSDYSEDDRVRIAKDVVMDAIDWALESALKGVARFGRLPNLGNTLF